MAKLSFLKATNAVFGKIGGRASEDRGCYSDHTDQVHAYINNNNRFI